jgi:hypothetical protein
LFVSFGADPFLQRGRQRRKNALGPGCEQLEATDRLSIDDLPIESFVELSLSLDGGVLSKSERVIKISLGPGLGLLRPILRLDRAG